MLKPAILKTLSLSAVLVLGFLISGCGGKRTAKKMDPSVGEFVYAYTSGTISRTAPIRVRMTSGLVSSSDYGTEVQDGVLKFYPEIDGIATWENDRTILFKPTEPLPSGETFVGELQVKQLFKSAPAQASTFEFEFRTRDQFLDIQVLGLQTPDPTDLSTQKLLGKIRTTDVAKAEQFARLVTVRQGRQNLDVEWVHDPGMLTHHFTVPNIKRGKNAEEISIKWNAKPLGVEQYGNQNLELAALGDFKIINASIINEKDPYILLQFSEPLQKSQNLTGLVELSDHAQRLKYSVDGNFLRVYPKGQVLGDRIISAKAGIKNIQGRKMALNSEWQLQFQDQKPGLRLVGKGNILPNSEGMLFPFEAISLNHIDVEIFKIYESNILQFLQTNEIGDSYQLERVGKLILQKSIPLTNLRKDANPKDWTRYALDLNDLIERDPKAIYQVRIGFQKKYTNYFCNDTSDEKKEQDQKLETVPSEDGEIKSFWGGYYGRYGYYRGYSWRDKENPCKPAYYTSENFIRRNIIASDLGIIAKRGTNGEFQVAVTNLVSTDKITGAEIKVYDYQQQLIASVNTDGEGIAQIQSKSKPFFLVATKNEERGYLKLQDGGSLSLSRFDVSGQKTKKGLKGFLYGERGVWRPGDTLHLSFILEDKMDVVPENHPITFELRDPRGQLQTTIVQNNPVGNIYDFTTSTGPDAPTGNWNATIKAGGAVFNKILKIETVKPNRLKLALDFNTKELSALDETLNGDLQVRWLHGAPAKNLKAKVEMQIKSTNTSFEKYKDFEFDDPSKKYDSEAKTIFEDKLDADGKATIKHKFINNGTAPGKLVASFKSRAFESSGDFSIDNFSIPYSPYPHYVGVKIPQNKYGGKSLDKDKTSEIQIVAVDEKGNPSANREVKVELYKIEWRWWWEATRGDRTSFAGRHHFTKDHEGYKAGKNLTTKNNGQINWQITPKDWGRYMVRICDVESGHCTADFFYSGYAWGNDEQARKEAAMLTFKSDKEQYNVGDIIELSIPAAEKSKALISIENGTQVISTYWENMRKGDNTVKIEAEENMAPNVYAHVTLVQPHSQTGNDLPIRMYGVIPIKVEDPKTKIQPLIDMPKELQPEKTFAVNVSEKDGKAMNYTLAIVDDGLLDLTRFKTPNPHETFYAKEALGVQTWDVYDYVLGAFGSKLERILSIGGDMELRKKKKSKANRFKPVVMHLGPFQLQPGEKAKHEIKMPNYIGSVRTMVVAGSDNNAYGSAEVTTPVKKSLMVLATLPRVLSPTETLKLPVNVFAMDDKIKNVNIRVETNELLSIEGDKTQTMSFSRPGDDLAFFNIKVNEGLGIGKAKVTVSGHGETSTHEIELDVRNPNPFVSQFSSKVIEPGQSWAEVFDLVGMKGTNSGVLEISNIPPINLGERLDYLIRYPHGCLEQTTSAAFPQLYVHKLLELTEEEKTDAQNNIKAAISKFKKFQKSNGGFGYWPGARAANPWSTNYVGHFLLEAKNLGYNLPPNMLENWIKFQKKVAKRWSKDLEDFDMTYSYRGNNQLMQAYRLYTLALAQEPHWAAMNRLREYEDIQPRAAWRLAAAYAIAGKPEVARELVAGLDFEVDDYTELGYTFGSSLRDQAMILEALVAMNKRDDAGELVELVSEKLNAKRWYSTHSTSFALLAVGKFVGNSSMNNQFNFTYTLGEKSAVNAGSTLPLMQIPVGPEELEQKSVNVKNTSDGILYAKLILKGQPVIGNQSAHNKNLDMSVKYKTMSGKVLDPTAIAQGTDFIAEVTIKNPGIRGDYAEIALEQVFPAGWEIHNSRMDNIQAFKTTSVPEYQDIRDDRVYTYFDIRAKKMQVYRIQLNAAYEGKFYLPTVYCSAMYDNSISSKQPGKWVEVTKAKPM